MKPCSVNIQLEGKDSPKIFGISFAEEVFNLSSFFGCIYHHFRGCIYISVSEVQCNNLFAWVPQQSIQLLQSPSPSKKTLKQEISLVLNQWQKQSWTPISHKLQLKKINSPRSLTCLFDSVKQASLNMKGKNNQDTDQERRLDFVFLHLTTQRELPPKNKMVSSF